MLNEREEKFIKQWEANRLREKKLWRQLAVGLPIGAIFGLGIMINFFSGWYTRAEMVANSEFNPWVLVVAVVIIVVFVAIFSRKMQWERKEQAYLELLNKKKKTENNTKD